MNDAGGSNDRSGSLAGDVTAGGGEDEVVVDGNEVNVEAAEEGAASVVTAADESRSLSTYMKNSSTV